MGRPAGGPAGNAARDRFSPPGIEGSRGDTEIPRPHLCSGMGSPRAEPSSQSHSANRWQDGLGRACYRESPPRLTGTGCVAQNLARFLMHRFNVTERNARLAMGQVD